MKLLHTLYRRIAKAWWPEKYYATLVSDLILRRVQFRNDPYLFSISTRWEGRNDYRYWVRFTHIGGEQNRRQLATLNEVSKALYEEVVYVLSGEYRAMLFKADPKNKSWQQPKNIAEAQRFLDIFKPYEQLLSKEYTLSDPIE